MVTVHRARGASAARNPPTHTTHHLQSLVGVSGWTSTIGQGRYVLCGGVWICGAVCGGGHLLCASATRWSSSRRELSTLRCASASSCCDNLYCRSMTSFTTCHRPATVHVVAVGPAWPKRLGRPLSEGPHHSTAFQQGGGRSEGES
jgi:hypothetical protein